MICRSLEEVRENIDSIDDRIISLIAERASFVAQAAAFKKNEEGVRAAGRVEQVILRVREKAGKYGAPPDIAEAVYRTMINGFINIEMKEFHNNK